MADASVITSPTLLAASEIAVSSVSVISPNFLLIWRISSASCPTVPEIAPFRRLIWPESPPMAELRFPRSGAATICALPESRPPAVRSLPMSKPPGSPSTETPAPAPEPWSIEIEPGSSEMSRPEPWPRPPSTETFGGVTVMPAEPLAPPCPSSEPFASMLTLRSLTESVAFLTRLDMLPRLEEMPLAPPSASSAALSTSVLSSFSCVCNLDSVLSESCISTYGSICPQIPPTSFRP